MVLACFRPGSDALRAWLRHAVSMVVARCGHDSGMLWAWLWCAMGLVLEGSWKPFSQPFLVETLGFATFSLWKAWVSAAVPFPEPLGLPRILGVTLGVESLSFFIGKRLLFRMAKFCAIPQPWCRTALPWVWLF